MSHRASATAWLMQRLYPAENGWIDGTTEFHELCAASIARGSRILEVGAGSENPTSAFLSSLGNLHGLDVDMEIKDNRALNSKTIFGGLDFPFEPLSFDACVSNYVLEHVGHPLHHLREVERVLRPGGRYIFRTPNRLHYVALGAGALPHWVHIAIANRLRGLAEHAHGPHHTVYGLNTRRRVRRLAGMAGLEVDLIRMVEKEPSYGMASPALFLVFAGYERVVNKTNALAFLRANMFGVLRKPNG